MLLLKKNQFFVLLLALLALAGLRPAQAQLYVVREGQLPYAGRTQYSVNTVVDGAQNPTREFFQDFMKDQYRVSFRGGLAALVGIGKKDILSAKQQSGTFVSSRPVDFYVAFTTLADSTTEVALFGGFGDKTYFSPDLTTVEFKRLVTMMEKYAPAARINFYRQQVKAAEDAIAAINKEKDKLNKHVETTQNNTATNLRRIEELLRQNQANATQLRQDSVQLVANGQNRQAAQVVLDKRRARLSTVAPR